MDKLRTKDDHGVIMLYTDALKIYQDSLSVWEIDALKAEVRHACSQSVNVYIAAPLYSPENKPLYEQNEAIYRKWGAMLDQGLIPAYQVDDSIPGQGGPVATMPRSK